MASELTTQENGNGNGNGQVPATLPRSPLGDFRSSAAEIGMSMLAERSIETVHHSEDVVLICDAICDELGIEGAEREDVVTAARLHDIGKSCIPREVLEKEGPLDDTEWALMRKHTVLGQQLLTGVAGLEEVALIVRSSHERWDGDGYPDGLAGQDIPLASRIIFCADAFHAIRADRPYRNGRPAAEALKEVRRCRGTQFDPVVVAAFEEAVRKLRMAPARVRNKPPRRLVALLLAICVGAAGSAVARSGLIGWGGSDDSDASSGDVPAAQCAAGDCAPSDTASAKARAAHEAKAVHVAALAAGTQAARAVKVGPRSTNGNSESFENHAGAAGTAPVANAGSAWRDPGSGGGSGNGGGSGSDGSKGLGPGTGSGGPASNNPHGSPPGQNGGPPASNNPHGSPPGQDGGPPASNNPLGGPPGQQPDHGSGK